MATTIELSDILAPITVTFKQLVASLFTIGTKGNVLYAHKDTTLTNDFSVSTFKSALNLSITDATVKKNVQYMFDKGAQKVFLFSYKDTLDAVSAQLDKYSFNWIVSDDAASQATVSAYAKEKDIFGLVHGVAGDSVNVINCTNPSVVDTNGNTIDILTYLPILAGALAGTPYTMAATGLSFTDLERVNMPEELHAGELVLYNESDEVKIAAAVNTLVTTTTNLTEDMKDICIVEGMKRFKTDHITTFKKSYKGRYKNSYDNQCLYIAASKGYIKDLEDMGILDPEYNNTVDINVDKLRRMWIADGKDEETITKMSDAAIKKLSFKKMMYLKFDVKFLDAIEGIEIEVDMY